MKHFVVDTNAFLRLILNDIPNQADQVEKLIKQAKLGTVSLIVPQVIIFEIEFALSKYYQFSKEEIIDKLSSIISSPYLEIEDKEIFRKSVDLYQTKNLSLVDCFLISKAELAGAELFTFDKNLKKLA